MKEKCPTFKIDCGYFSSCSDLNINKCKDAISNSDLSEEEKQNKLNSIQETSGIINMKEKAPTPEDFKDHVGHEYKKDDPRHGMEVEVDMGIQPSRDGVVYGETDVVTNFHGTDIGDGFYIGTIENPTIEPTICAFSKERAKKKGT